MSQSAPPVVVLVPAYQPSDVLLVLAREVLQNEAFELVVVDDGSGLPYRRLFDQVAELPRAHILRHAVNLGKGAALKTGMNYTLSCFPAAAGVVTADADGQHHVEDIERVAGRLARSPAHLILGFRQFGRDVPLRNRFGNTLTRGLVRLLMGQKLADTQTGLRGIPLSLIGHLLRIEAAGYEFELDMLTTARHHGFSVEEEPIRTIYDHPNRATHFRPLVDSMKIYFVLLRFSFVSLLTAAIDNLVFLAAFHWLANIAAAQTISRAAAVLFNYTAARRAVFLSRERHATIFPKFVALVIVNGFISYALITFVLSWVRIPVIWAKVGVESAMFLANFAIQRDFIFIRKRDPATAED